MCPYSSPPHEINLQLILSNEVIGGIPVPLFFILSGYLFFTNVDCFDFDTYKRKLSKRIKTLLVPYILWNIIAYIVYVLDHNFSIIDFLKSFIYLDTGRGGHPPVNGPLWFLRDLMIIMLLTPIIWSLVKRTNFYLIILILALNIIGEPNLFKKGIVISFVYFSIGAWFGIKKIRITPQGNVRRLWIGAFIMATIAHLFIRDYSVHRVYLLIGIVSVLSLFSLVSEKIDSIPKFIEEWGAMTFFIFGLHDLLLPYLYKICNYSLNNLLEIHQTDILYLTIVFIDIAICLMAYYCLRITIPKFLPYLTGGR